MLGYGFTEYLRTILSVPYRNRPSELPDGLAPEDAAQRVAAGSSKLRPRVPAAIGHCMYIKRMALDLVGEFDEEFSPGYGEEVDFCQRCHLLGLAHVCADDVFVYHHGAASFNRGRERDQLRERHERVIAKRYPYYHPWVQREESDQTGVLATALGAARQSNLLEPVFTAAAFQNGSSSGSLKVGNQVTVLTVTDIKIAKLDGEKFDEVEAAAVLSNSPADARASATLLKDPSICFNLEVTNLTGFDQTTTLTVNLPFLPITMGGPLAGGGFDMSSALDAVLTDGAADGVTVTQGIFPSVLTPTLTSTFSAGLSVLNTIQLGTPPITLPGISEAAGPAPGFFLPAGQSFTGMFLFVSLTLSPGDTANVTGVVDLDVGSGVPVCTIPPLPVQAPVPPPGGGGTPPPDQIPALSHWGMILLTLSLLLLASWQLAGQPARLATGQAKLGLRSPPDRRRLLRSLLIGQGLAAVGLLLYGVLVAPPAPHDGVGAFLAGILIGMIIEFCRRGRELDSS